MRNFILTLATLATLGVSSFAMPSTAEARPYRYYSGGQYYGYSRPYYRSYSYYRPYTYRSYYYGPRYYPGTRYYGYPGYRTASPGIYLGAPGAGVYIR